MVYESEDFTVVVDEGGLVLVRLKTNQCVGFTISVDHEDGGPELIIEPMMGSDIVLGATKLGHPLLRIVGTK